MAVGTAATFIDSVFFGLLYGSMFIIALVVGFAIWHIFTFKHKVILYEVSENGIVGRVKIHKCRERKDKNGALLWSGRFGKIPQPPAGFTRVCGRGNMAQAYWYEEQALWIKPEPRIADADPDFIQKLDLFTGSQKGSYVNIEEQAAKKRFTGMDRVLQFVNVSVLLIVLLVVVFSWSELTSTPKELASQIAPISENFEKAANQFAKTAEKLGNNEKGVQQLQDKNSNLPEEPPQ